MTDKITVLSTCGSPEEAEAIAKRLVEGRFVACVNIVPGVRSIYRWKGAIEESRECLLFMKTTRDLFGPLREEFRKLHSYEVPELVAIPIVDGLDQYLSWIGDSVR